jgi:hypothetical protein
LVAATIDGKHSQDVDGCWLTSRTSNLPNVPDWPALRQVTVDPTIHQSEDWTATLSKFSEAEDKFEFSVNGTFGTDGTGQSDKDFVSPSGHIRISAEDWMLADAAKLSGKRLPDGFQIHWQRRYICGDQPSVPIGVNKSEVRYVIGTGLPNAGHKLSLSILPEGEGLVQQILVYRPLLH